MAPSRRPKARGAKQTAITQFFGSKNAPRPKNPSPKQDTFTNTLTNGTPASSHSLFKLPPLKHSLHPSTTMKEEPKVKPVDEDTMDVDTPTPPLDPGHDLTQEELNVHDQLESLDCSQPGDVNTNAFTAARLNSRASSSTTRNFSFASNQNYDTKQNQMAKRTPVKDEQMTDDDDSEEKGTPKGKKRSSLGSLSDLDDSSDDEITREAEQRRRSSRTVKAVVRYGMEQQRRPNGFLKTTDMSRKASELDRELRLVAQKNKKREELDKIRQQLEENRGRVAKDEAQFACKADAMKKDEEARLASMHKFSSPVSLFIRKVQYPPIPVRYRRSPNQRPNIPSFKHNAVCDLLLLIDEEGDWCDNYAIHTVLRPAMKRFGSTGEPSNLAFLIPMYYWMLVYDKSDDLPESDKPDGLHPGLDRSDLLDDFLALLCSATSEQKEIPIGFPSLVSALRDYGAEFSEDLREVSDQKVDEGALDAEVPYLDGLRVEAKGFETSKQFNRALRNLGRAMKLSATLIKCGLPISNVINEEMKHLDRTKMVLYTLGVCVRVLLSAFGCRLHHETGEVISAVLKRIPVAEWTKFRLQAALFIVSLTPRLEQHLELVTYLLPSNFRRSRYLAMDVGYLSLQQWCAGPSTNPAPRKLDGLDIPSAKAMEKGVEAVSYCLEDIISITGTLTNMGQDTDINWAEYMGALIKVVIADGRFLSKRNSDELTSLSNILQAIRGNTTRMVFDVPVQRMRISVDASLKMTDEFRNRNL